MIAHLYTNNINEIYIQKLIFINKVIKTNKKIKKKDKKYTKFIKERFSPQYNDN